MKKRITFRTMIISLSMLILLFLSMPRQLLAVEYPDPSVDPYIPFTLQAPWYADLEWTAGGTGSFYGDDPYHHYADKWALDFNAPDRSDADSLVLAAADGVVVKAECDLSIDTLGCKVVLGHIAYDGYCYQTIYGHLLEGSFFASVGDWVPQGHPIGRVGNTGLQANREHLHFTIHRRPISECGANAPYAYRDNMAVVPEPLANVSGIQDGQLITSTTYPVGLPALEPSLITSQSSPYLRAAQPIIDVYRRRGGQYLSFGRALGPVEETGGVQYQEFAPFQPPGYQSTPGYQTVIVAREGDAAFMYDEMWSVYRQNIDLYGFPQADTYIWRQGSIDWYRVDFDNNISLLWNGGEGNRRVIETIDEQNGEWEGRFWPVGNQFEGDAYLRRDKVIDFHWPSARNSGPYTDSDGFSAHWQADIGGFFSRYTLSVDVQGHAAIYVDGNLVREIPSPEGITTIDTLQWGFGAERVEIFYWQEASRPGLISVTTDDSLIGTVFASDGLIEVESLPSPEFTYAEYPPGLRDEQFESSGSGSCPINTDDGVDFHQQESATGAVYVGCIDLTDPHLRFETVMANDILNVNPATDQRETIQSMVSREPHNWHNPILAFNADYFGDGHGAEGFTINNGLRIDGPYSDDFDGNETDRVSQSVSRVSWVELERKLPGEVTDQILQLSRFYNSTGGGPTIVQDGLVINDPCGDEGFPPSVCEVNTHTAVGVTEDGQTFIVVVAESNSAVETGQILQSYGAHTGIKLSGGTTSQLWYRGDSIVEGNPVANGMVIFREAIPRHDTILLEQSRFPVVEAGHRFSVTMRLGNTGFLPWESQLDYALQHVAGEHFAIPAPRFLPATVNPGYDLTIALEGIAPTTPGAYQSIWQFIYQDSQGYIEPVSDEIGFLVTVVPEGTSPDIIDSLQQVIDQFQAEIEGNLSAYLDELEQELEDRIEAELRRILPPEFQCLLGMSVIFSNGWLIAFWRRKGGR